MFSSNRIIRARVNYGFKLNEVLTSFMINRRYAELMKQDHPDHGGAGLGLDTLRVDRKLLLSTLED